MIVVAKRGLGADLPSTVTDNATLLQSEVQRLDTDIQACKGTLPAAFVASWEVWRDTANALANSVQNSAWYEVAAGGLWIAVKQAFSGDGIRAMMESLIKWRDQAQAKGCMMSGPGPTVPPMPLSDKILWTAAGLAGAALVVAVVYGVVTKQGPVQIISRIARR